MTGVTTPEDRAARRRPVKPDPATARRRRRTALAVVAGIVLGLVAALAALGSGGSGSKQAGPTGPPPGPVSILWVGDTTLGSSAGDPPQAGRGLFAGMRSRLQKADLTFANLEGTLARDVPGTSNKCGDEGGGTCFSFAAPATFGASLKWAGIDIVNLANNHASDFGPAGEAATIKALFANGIAHTGLPGEITVLRRGTTRVAFVGFAPYPWAARLDVLPQVTALVRKAATMADVVVVAMHAGAEGRDAVHTPVGIEEAYGENRGDTRGFAHAAIDAGADLVVGSGPHVVRGIEQYEGKLIAYSLGNFAGWDNFARGDVLNLSGMIKVTLSGTGRTLKARWTPVVLDSPGVPRVDGSGESTALVRQLSQDDFGATAAKIDDDGTITPPGPATPPAATPVTR